jgi:hypothetical protein
MAWLVIFEYDCSYTYGHTLTLVVSDELYQVIQKLNDENLPQLSVVYGQGNDSIDVELTLVDSKEISETVKGQIESTINKGYALGYIKWLEQLSDDTADGGMLVEFQDDDRQNKKILYLGTPSVGEFEMEIVKQKHPRVFDFVEHQVPGRKPIYLPRQGKQLTSKEVKEILPTVDTTYWFNPHLERFMEYYPKSEIVPKYFKGGAFFMEEDDAYCLLNGASQDEIIAWSNQEAPYVFISEEEALDYFKTKNKERDLSDIYVYLPEEKKCSLYMSLTK